jgi:hypothetical protein
MYPGDLKSQLSDAFTYSDIALSALCLWLSKPSNAAAIVAASVATDGNRVAIAAIHNKRALKAGGGDRAPKRARGGFF